MKKFTIVLTGLLLACTACHKTAPEERVHQLMTDRMVTLATAESCTGGTIAARFTALPGASAYFKCGIVAYSNESIRNMLGICCDTLARYGTVSEQVVRQMAEAVRQTGSSDYGIATTGIAGPSGGTAELPVGSVWIAVATPVHTISRLIHAQGDRDAIIRQAGTEVIELLESELRKECPSHPFKL